jgi:RNA polymerase sigma-70 factor (sigma-E family)
VLLRRRVASAQRFVRASRLFDVEPLVVEVGDPVDVGDDKSEALAVLFTKHYGQLVRTASLLLGDIAAGEDVVQEAFIRVNGVIRRGDMTVGLGYLQRTVVNLARSDLRRRVVALRHAPKPMPDAAGADVAAMVLLQSADLIAALKTLPRRQREAVVLRYCDDQSEADTARLMGVSPGAVKAYASRGMATLRTQLEESA